MENVAINHVIKKLMIDCNLKREDIAEILDEAKQKKISFITCLMQTKKIESLYLAKLLAKEFFLDYLDLDTLDTLQIPCHLLDKTLQQRFKILPLSQDKKKLNLVLADPSQQIVFDTIRFRTGLCLEYKITDEKKLSSLLEKVISLKSIVIHRSMDPKQDGDAQQDAINNPNLSIKSAANNDVTIINYVYQLLLDAIRKNASDVHLEPLQGRLTIRFRIDGLLYSSAILPKPFMSRVITRLKIMAQLDIAERRIPQDGRFQVKDKFDRNVDCRLSTCPTIHGEKLVIRILDSNQMLLKIDKLGMNEKQKNEFITALKSPHGMILVTGPTGSGKTITLYTALNFLKHSTVNISTVENPIEIILPGINQVNINPAIHLTFACVLRAFLRQDPDIIMVGEMRDQETAEIGIKAAQTGHLVLSTLHTNSAIESLIRLENMNIPTYNIVASVNLIIAQRLVRRLCDRCKIETPLPKEFIRKLNLITDSKIKTFAAKGCAHCTEGYKGRTGIFEILTLTEKIKKGILKKNSMLEIKKMAEKQGMQTLYSSALEKLKQGVISVLEMERVIKD